MRSPVKQNTREGARTKVGNFRSRYFTGPQHHHGEEYNALAHLTLELMHIGYIGQSAQDGRNM